MDKDEARKLIEDAKIARYHPIIGSLRLAAYARTNDYKIWVWLDEAGNEHVSKAEHNGDRYGWSPNCLDRGESFIESNGLKRIV